MKTTARILIGLISAALGFSVALSFADQWSTGNDTSLGRVGAGQVAGHRAEDARRRSDDLLRRARQAIAEDNLEAASSLVSEASSLAVDYGRLYTGETPQKVQRDLDRKLQAAGNFPHGLGQLFSPLSRRETPSTDPFAAHRQDGQTAQMGTGQHTTPLPPIGSASAPDNPPGYLAGAPNAAAANRARSDELLLAARKALAEGDVARAAETVENAKTLNVQYGFSEDGPAKVEAAIASYRDLAAHPADQRNTNAYRAKYARVLMEQAKGLLRYRDYDKAEHLASLAARQNVSFGPYQESPDKLAQQIADARRQDRSTSTMGAPIPGSASLAPSMAAKQRAMGLLRQGRMALSAGDLQQADDLARWAVQQQVPDSAFGPAEDRPNLLLLDIQRAAMQNGSGVITASGQSVIPATGNYDPNRRASHTVYNPDYDYTRNRLAQAQQDTPRPLGGTPGGPTIAPPPVPFQPSGDSSRSSVGETLFLQGEAALAAHNTPRAMDLFRQAAQFRNQLDPVTDQKLQDRLLMLGASQTATNDPMAPPPPMINQGAASQQLAQQVGLDVANQESQARKIREAHPRDAIALLQETRQKVEAAGLDPTVRDRYLAKIDRALAETQDYVDLNLPRIELEERNQRTIEEVKREHLLKEDIDNRLAQMTDEINRLRDEHRFAEAEVVALRAQELAPENPVAVQLVENAKFIRRYANNLEVADAKERGFWQQMANVDESSIGFDDNTPLQFGDAREWEALSLRRRATQIEYGRARTEQDLEIEQKLKTPVLLQFQDAPLSQVMDYLGRMAAINVYLDPAGLADAAVTSDDPVTINLSQEVSLESALKLILRSKGLGYVIKDEVLKVTSEQLRDGNVYQDVYYVADLVMPIPNFQLTGLGLVGAYHDALGSVGFGGSSPFGGVASPLSVLASRGGGWNQASLNPNVLAQMPSGAMGGSPITVPAGGGPGGLGGGAMADFDSLIDLIVTTVQPTTWDDVGGPGSIAPFPTNLSLVISQTQEVHEEIVDLLEQLRRMQDLQVTIEVRFITLNDNFFERIGVDFDFDLDDDIDRPFQVFGREIPGTGDPQNGTEPARNTLDVDHDDSVTVGLQTPGVFSADLDIPFTQNSFGLAVPQFGGFDASAGAQMGFAILSDIEAFFFLSAAQGDRRSNVMQAPKVTLFNGQQASIYDTSQSPFVMSVVPVVGDFAAAQQPVIVVLSEGTFLTVQAVVSSDRRFVRLTLVPSFSRIGDVETFTFDGTTTTTDDSSSSVRGNQDDPNDATRNDSDSSRTTTTQGTTVQLPTFSTVGVNTTVSVPDGGTILMGGIKRLSEGRNEFGVPMLNKLPYINRLFKNVSVGRETQSLMMMVTPRIIIQEEEEERLGITP